MKELEIIQVIHTTLKKAGKGVDGDPIRRVHQYWLMDGTLLFESDEFWKPEAH